MRASILIIAAVAFAGLLGPTVHADHGHRGRALEARQASAESQAAALVRERTGGRILGVRAAAGQPGVYLVRTLLAGGRVRTYRVDLRTGQVWR